ncbi:MAG: flagellar motor switch FliN [Clostridiales bacterium]|jgi:flagellar motor switch protein FliN/FliY|nr:flagellar motor switch FliN [Clostridiales bacterium]
MGLNNLTEQHIRQMLNLDEDKGNSKSNNIKKAQFCPLKPADTSGDKEDLSFLKNIDVEIEVQLGDTELTLGEILELKEESIIPLNKMAGDTVDIYLNKHWLASGEVVVINEEYGVRINSFKRDRDLPEN